MIYHLINQYAVGNMHDYALTRAAGAGSAEGTKVSLAITRLSAEAAPLAVSSRNELGPRTLELRTSQD